MFNLSQMMETGGEPQFISGLWIIKPYLVAHYYLLRPSRQF